MTLIVAPHGITSMDLLFESPRFRALNQSFTDWIRRFHPEDALKAGEGYTSVEEARDFGSIRGQYALEWAAYLEANGCPWDTAC